MNPESDSPNALSDNELTETVLVLAADWQRTTCQLFSVCDIEQHLVTELEQVVETWPFISNKARVSILGIVEEIR